ncbi:Calcium homeostasis modulator protein 3 [Heterocephalus glaber]|uniref:Calcium homeostasis modulator protein 3 n=1 Tax=Heterocephalus glaber TaxID=10181 RepID=G5CAJ6_HETGA|nr:calcium homeostasis modulator protein 3 [Heterocephalus glaber]EHB18557.1 Calcium homeostasis modulator protein 3 [Heterocephalus glaber]
MERFRSLFQHFQSSSESVTNGLCLLLAALTIKLYSSCDFSCPCLAQYNALYGLGLLLLPPLALFLCGLLVNRQSAVMVDEWCRPVGHRGKDLGIIRYMCSSMLQRALAAPLVWILLALLDGKCFVCAFSNSVDPEKFLDFANMTSSQVQLFLAKVPCKEDELVRDSPARKAVSRYLRCLSQAIGWSLTLLLIVVAFLARCLRPCFDQTVFLQRRYWSNYVDLEQKLFDETCCEHARDFAHRCVLHFFASMRGELRAWGLRQMPSGSSPEPAKPSLLPEDPEDPDGRCRKAHLRAVCSREQVDGLLSSWYSGKPPLELAASPGFWGAGLSHRGPMVAPGTRLSRHTDV